MSRIELDLSVRVGQTRAMSVRDLTLEVRRDAARGLLAGVRRDGGAGASVPVDWQAWAREPSPAAARHAQQTGSARHALAAGQDLFSALPVVVQRHLRDADQQGVVQRLVASVVEVLAV